MARSSAYAWVGSQAWADLGLTGLAMIVAMAGPLIWCAL